MLTDLEVINLDVKVEERKVVKAVSSGNKLRGFEKTFIGKKAEEFYYILPRVLATCSQSHVYAYTKLFSDRNNNIEKTLVMLEIMESHIKHPYMYWFPNLTKDPRYDFPSGDKFKRVAFYAKKLREVMEMIGGKWPHVDYLRGDKSVIFRKNMLKEFKDFFEREVIGMESEQFMEVSSLEELESNNGDIGFLVKLAEESLFWNLGLRRYLVVGFPFQDSMNISLLKDEGVRVTYNGLLVEVGPLAQALTFDKLIKRYHEKYGPSPLLRELARLKIVAKLLLMLEDFEIESEKFKVSNGSYVSYVESIRGSLIHYFDIKDNLIMNYRIIQPTTIIASPSGALENAVLGLRVNDVKDPKEIALSVSSLDTCFVTNVRIYDENNRLITTKRIGGFC
jgi:hydrogenase large subunit